MGPIDAKRFFLGVFLLFGGIWVGHVAWPSSRFTEQIRITEVDVIKNTPECAKKGGQIIGKPLTNLDDGTFVGGDYYGHFECRIPAKTIEI